MIARSALSSKTSCVKRSLLIDGGSPTLPRGIHSFARGGRLACQSVGDRAGRRRFLHLVRRLRVPTSSVRQSILDCPEAVGRERRFLAGGRCKAALPIATLPIRCIPSQVRVDRLETAGPPRRSTGDGQRQVLACAGDVPTSRGRGRSSMGSLSTRRRARFIERCKFKLEMAAKDARLRLKPRDAPSMRYRARRTPVESRRGGVA